MAVRVEIRFFSYSSIQHFHPRELVLDLETIYGSKFTQSFSYLDECILRAFYSTNKHGWVTRTKLY